jgi:hypothetical protein
MLHESRFPEVTTVMKVQRPFRLASDDQSILQKLGIPFIAPRSGGHWRLAA